MEHFKKLPIPLLFGWINKKMKNSAMKPKRFIAGVLAFIILFTSLPWSSIVQAEPKTIYGDVNQDTTINKDDVSALKKYLAEYEISIDLNAADVNVDGVIDLKDLLLLQQYVAGLDVILGEAVTIIFHTNGGSSVAPIKLCKGATLASVIDTMPVTQKSGYIFAGWVAESGEPIYSEDVFLSNVNAYAKYIKIPDQENLSVSSFSLEDQSTSLSFTVVSDKAMTISEVRNALTLLAMDGTEPVDLEVIKVSDTIFTVKAKDGFNEGSAYQLILSEELNFKDKERSIRTANFTIYKKPVDNLTFNEDIIYIKDTDSMDYMLTGATNPVPVLETAMLSNNKSNEAVVGYFYYSSASFTVGTILCIYENIHPTSRDYVNNRYDDDAMAYIEVTAIHGTKISFKSINEEDAEKVFFLPDTIPFSVPVLPSANSGTVSAAEYDNAAWITMGYTGTPEFNVGDFLVFYNGAFADITEETTVYFAEVTAVNGNTVTYKKTTTEAIKKSQEMYINNPVSGDDLLENIDTGLLEDQIEKQAIESGFAEEAAKYLANAAQETDGFKNMKLQAFTVQTSTGKNLTAKQLKNIGGSWELAEGVSVTATIGKSSKYFNDGINLSLRIDAEFTVDVGEDGELKILLSATFVEEIAVDIDISANAKITWILFVPIFKSIKFGAAVSVKNYSAISLDVKIYTVQKEEESFWEKLKGINKDFGSYLEKAEELKNKIDEAKETVEKIKGYKEDLENLWSTIKTMSNGSVTQNSYETLVDTLGEMNVTQEMIQMLHITTDEEMEAGVQDLMKRYSEMLETESDWITLVEKEIFSRDEYIKCFVIHFELNFIVKANVNIALGANLEYVVGKRYSFWIDIVKKTSGSSVMDLLDERFAFQFYAMGALGIKMGVEAKIAVGIGSTRLGSIGVSAEFGPYIKLWGYFIYEYSKMRPAGTNSWLYDERKMGALYLEFGLYLEVAFEAQVLDGLLSYNPTLYDKEFPLLTAGNRKNYYDFAYEIEDDECVIIEDVDRNSNNGISMILPENYRLMNYIDLVEGNLEKEIGDYSRFIATLSNRNFHFDNETGAITVDVPKGVQYMECDLILTWKMGKLEFVSRDITVTIPLVWTNLSTEELNQKFTATVKVGNSQDGYTTVWSSRVKKNTAFSLPTEDEILELIGYDNYSNGSENLKYESVTGYGTQSIEDLTIYADTTYYFNVTLKEYTLTVKNVQDKNGNISDMQFKAKYGESFDLSKLLISGTKNSKNGIFTAYLKTEATLNGSTTIGTGLNAREINQNISKPIDNVFANQILSGVVYTAKYTDNSVKATYIFTGRYVNIADKTVTIEKGTTPPDIFSEELSNLGIQIKSISPLLSIIISDATFVINCELSVTPKYWLTYHTNGGSNIDAKEINQDSLLIRPADPEKLGYLFDGWYTNADLTEPFNFTNAIMPGNSLDLYAKWVGETKKVTFDSNEGDLPTGTENTTTVTYGESYGTLPTPVRIGYKFLGWYTSRTGGTKVTGADTVDILNDIVVFAQWQEKMTINPNVITYEPGQSTVYNRNEQPFIFTIEGLSSDSFEVYYKRQGLDNSYTTKAINAGTYDIKFVYKEDENYKYFETLLIGVYIIEKAESTILTAPEAAEVYYGNIAPKKMVYDVDYIGDGALQYAVGTTEQYVVNPGKIPVIIGTRPKEPTSGWSNSGVIYNIYDSGNLGTRLYLWVRLAEGENYKASTSKVSTEMIDITNKPKSLMSSKLTDIGYIPEFSYRLTIKTSDIDKAGTNSNIYIKIGDGQYQHLDNPGDDFERGDTNVFSVNIDPNLLYNTCYGTIPVTLKYVKDGTSAGWHCEWIRLDVYNFGYYDILGNVYRVNHWFGAEDYDKSTIEETYNLTGYERATKLDYGTIFSTQGSRSLDEESKDFKWKWTNPVVQDLSRAQNYMGFKYNPYTLLNAPEINVTFGNAKYDRYITRGVTSFSIDNQELRKAMIADGVTELNLTYRIEFKPVNGNRSVRESHSLLREETIRFTCKDAAQGTLNENTSYLLSQSAKTMFSLYCGQQDNVDMQVTPGANGTFDVSYSIKENVGIWGTKFAVNYDKTKVELLSYTLGNVFTTSEVTAPERFDNGRYVFFANRSDFTDTTTTGKLVTLTFKIRDGVTLTDYPVTLDTSVMQSINAESGIVTVGMDSNAPKISVSGNTGSILKQDKVTISVSAGTSTIASVEVKKNNGEYSDITDSYENGYTVTENGTYTFKLVTVSGESAVTTITYTGIDTVKPVVSLSAGNYIADTWTKGDVTLSVSNTAQNLGTTSFMYKKGNGEWINYTSPIVITDDTGEVTYSFKAISEAGIESDVKTIVVKMDKVLPNGDIKIGTTSIKKVLNTITFGLFFKETQAVIIEASDDESGVAKVEYYLANDKVEDVTSISEWTDYSGSFNINPNDRYVIYVRLTDNVGNSVIINSDGIIIENVVPVIIGITDGKIYCEAQTVTVSDNNLDKVTLNGTTVELQDGKFTVSPQNGKQTIIATDKSGNMTTVTITVNNDHTWDDGEITTVPTASTEGVKTHTCLHCGETKTESVAKLSPVMIGGQNSSWQQDSNTGLTFRSDAAFSDFISVLVDGNVIDAINYELKEGSIIVTLKADYLVTLSAGTHTFAIQSVTGTASTEFTVTAKANTEDPTEPESPQTGDNSNMIIWITLLFISGGALTVFGMKVKKRKTVN